VIEISHAWLSYVGFAIAALAMSYSVLVWLIARRVKPGIRSGHVDAPPVTILKPLCGAEPETYECLRSFCAQDYPVVQIVFGLREATDPALAIVTRLQREFPHRDLQVVIDRRRHGGNAKVSNLINMMPSARHAVLILADSDVRVRPDYLAHIVPPLLDRTVGIVTCPYRGVARPGLWSHLGSMYINEWFMPSVRVAAAGGSQSFASGATIGIRAQVLAQIGGFAAIANELADDFRLGELTRLLGLRTVLSQVEVETMVEEPTFVGLLRHETRWLRTIRALRPIGYGSLVLTFGLPITALEALWSRGAPLALGMFGVALLARVLLHLTVRRRGLLWQVLLVPLRDFLNVGLWGWGFVTRRVRWREQVYRISREGLACPILRIHHDADAQLDEPRSSRVGA
jgi:ceramide glucosyltransferase